MLQDQEPLNEAKKSSLSGFAIFLKIIAVICVFGGFILGTNLSDTWIDFSCWFIGGIISAIFWWALSIIVAACHKYIN